MARRIAGQHRVFRGAWIWLLAAGSWPACGAVAADAGTGAPAFAQAEPRATLIASDFTLARDGSRPNEGDVLALAEEPVAPPPPSYGPPLPASEPAPDSRRGLDPERYRTFGAQVGAVKWELLGLLAYMTAVNADKLFKDPTSPHFHSEGFFGDDTSNLGVDKFGHAFNSYVFADFLHWRIARKAGDTRQAALTASLLSVGVQAYGELYDSIERDGGWSWEDTLFNVAGAGFSYVRNVVPGLKDKLDFRVEIRPNHEVFTFRGREHFRQQRFLFALTLAGFEGLRHSPLRFVELQAGYFASGFTTRERQDGDPLRRRPFVGIGINLKELFFGRSRSTFARIAGTVLDYVQVPYTEVHYDGNGF